MRPARRRWASVACVLLIVSNACGDGDDDVSARASSSPTDAPTATTDQGDDGHALLGNVRLELPPTWSAQPTDSDALSSLAADAAAQDRHEVAALVGSFGDAVGAGNAVRFVATGPDGEVVVVTDLPVPNESLDAAADRLVADVAKEGTTVEASPLTIAGSPSYRFLFFPQGATDPVGVQYWIVTDDRRVVVDIAPATSPAIDALLSGFTAP